MRISARASTVPCTTHHIECLYVLATPLAHRAVTGNRGLVCGNIAEMYGSFAEMCVAVCCSVLQCVAVREHSGNVGLLCRNQSSFLPSCATSSISGVGIPHTLQHSVTHCNTVLQCVAVCCIVLQCVAVCCSVLQKSAKDENFKRWERCWIEREKERKSERERGRKKTSATNRCERELQE